jgi:Zn-finger nucleic acid-binding protein
MPRYVWGGGGVFAATETLRAVSETNTDLICLKCRGRMRTYERNGITIDQCTACHGIFLDRGELERLIGAESSYLGAHPGEGPRADRDRGFLGDLFD